VRARVGLALGWLGCFAVYLVSLPGTFYFEDGPELLACAASLGNTHPPGYALLTLLGRLILALPVGAPGFRFNLLIACCAAGAVVAWGALVAHLTTTAMRSPDGVSASAETPTLASASAGVAAGVFTSGVWAFSDAFWWEASIGDKYAGWYLAFAALAWVSVLAMRAEFPDLPRAAAWTGFATGLSLAHHQFAVFVLPAVLCAAGRAALMRALGARLALGRAAVLAVVLAALPLSTKVLYPPLRSGGGAVLDWGRPGHAAHFRGYLAGTLYRGGFASTSLPRNPWLAVGRWRLAARFLGEEVPWLLLLAAPAGALLLARRMPLVAAAGACCLVANAGWAVNFSEKVVRWYEPAYAILLATAGIGWAWAFASVRGTAGRVALTLVVTGAIGWQGVRGSARNDLSRFYAAHDAVRNLLRVLPQGAVYLGAGDFDLFPLWAARLTEGARPDVEAAGLGGFVDPGFTASGAEDRILAAAGVKSRGVQGLAALLSLRAGPPVYVAASGNDRQLQTMLPFLKATEINGLAGRIVRAWAPAAGAASTRRAIKGMTLRNLRYHRPAGLVDLGRLRDEVARGALLQYPACLATLGQQCLRFGLDADAAWAFAAARAQMEALVGPLVAPPPAAWLPPLAARARRDQQAVALGYERLADVFAERGVTFLADQVRGNAAAVLQ